MSNPSDHVFVIEGNKEMVIPLQQELTKLGMKTLKVDFCNESFKAPVDGTSLQNEEPIFEVDFLGQNFEDGAYAFDLDPLVTIVVSLASSGVLAAIVNAVFAKPEISIERESSGNITKISLKNISPRKIPTILKSLSDSASAATVVSAQGIATPADGQPRELIE